MPPKKKDNTDTAAASDLGLRRAVRFGRVKNTLSMGFGTFCSINCYSFATVSVRFVYRLWILHNVEWYSRKCKVIKIVNHCMQNSLGSAVVSVCFALAQHLSKCICVNNKRSYGFFFLLLLFWMNYWLCSFPWTATCAMILVCALSETTTFALWKRTHTHTSSSSLSTLSWWWWCATHWNLENGLVCA
jgi:hypothetical protein